MPVDTPLEYWYSKSIEVEPQYRQSFTKSYDVTYWMSDFGDYFDVLINDFNFLENNLNDGPIDTLINVLNVLSGLSDLSSNFPNVLLNSRDLNDPNFHIPSGLGFCDPNCLS